MKRRTVLELLFKSFIFAPISARLLGATAHEKMDASETKFVLIYDSSSPSNFRKLIESAGPYLAERDPNWFEKLSFWNVRRDSAKIEAFIQKYGPNTKSVSWPILIAVPEVDGLEMEVETWTLEWLAHRERIEDACYPVSGGWWSVEGDWNPSIQKVRNHVYTSPNHAGGKFELPWLNLLKFEELQSLHSDHHREMIKQGKVYWKNVNVECPTISLG